MGALEVQKEEAKRLQKEETELMVNEVLKNKNSCNISRLIFLKFSMGYFQIIEKIQNNATLLNFCS